MRCTFLGNRPPVIGFSQRADTKTCLFSKLFLCESGIFGGLLDVSTRNRFIVCPNARRCQLLIKGGQMRGLEFINADMTDGGVNTRHKLLIAVQGARSEVCVAIVEETPENFV